MYYPAFRLIAFIIALLCALNVAQAQIKEYPSITAKKNGAENSLSPDPLISYKWAAPKASDELESYKLRPVSLLSSDPNAFDTRDFKENNIITVQGNGNIRFDFGRVSAGWLEFESDDLMDSISMSISEYNEPAIVNSGALHRFKTRIPTKNGHTYRLELNPELYEGVRFGWIHVRSHQQTWHIKNLRLVCQVKPVNYQGSFSCSDQELTKIWYTGAYTVKLNLQKDYFGAILMERSDRHSWTGDAYPSQAASMVAFGNYDFVKANIVNTANLDNGIASYALYWVLSLIDYVNYTGDTEFVKGYIENAAKKLDIAYQHYGKSPKLGFYGWDERIGAGFENPNIVESQNAYSMLSIRSWMEFGSLMKHVGRADLAQKYITYAHQKIEEKRKNKTWLDDFGLHASADAINTGLTNSQEDSLFYNHHYTDRVNRLSYSPFNEYFIIGAMAKMQRYNDAITAIKDCWGGQLKYGATTFFEVYRPGWNAILGENDAPPNNQCGYTSMTHPWSAGVVKWLSEEVLGIKPLQPGFSTFEIKPHLSHNLTWVKGGTPTIKGTIVASFNIDSGLTMLEIPEGTFAKQIAIPIGRNSVESLFLNGNLIWNRKKLTGKTYGKIELRDNYIYISGIKPGKYKYKVIYKKIEKVVPAKEKSWIYPISAFSQDSLTSGKWKDHYGKDGFILFNYLENGKHLQKLPDYLSSIDLKNERNIRMESLSVDNRILVNDKGIKSAFGAIATQDPQPTLQTMTLDLRVSNDEIHQLSMYFLDWDKKERRSAIEVFDAKTLKLIAPVQIIKDYQNGKYLVFNYSGNIRIRINQVRGENAALSGLFFDGPDIQFKSKTH